MKRKIGKNTESLKNIYEEIEEKRVPVISVFIEAATV